jgi:diguanylate cyclase (GGDEF)-like protein
VSARKEGRLPRAEGQYEPPGNGGYSSLALCIPLTWARDTWHDSQGEGAALLHLDNALSSWKHADAQATELTSVYHAPGDPIAAQAMERFHGHISATSDRLGQAYEAVAAIMEADHQTAISLSERAELLFGAALTLSLVAVVGGVTIIGLIMARSVDRLVDGATRFAGGDRHHRIEISVPPELNRVAQEFNHMIGRIEQSETALADLARIDELTQLHNRRAFDEALARQISSVERGGDSGALLTLDIDHFKVINDTYGHAAGDDVLRYFARVVRATLRPTDQPHRVGGEEFAIILPQTDMETASALADSVRRAIAAGAATHKDQSISMTVSIGVAPITEHMTPAVALEAADAALYRAKLSGRNRVVAVDKAGPNGPVVLSSGRAVGP